MNPLDLLPLFEMSDAAFRERFRDTALWRTKRRGLLRNAAIVLGNQRFPAAVEPLARGLSDPETVVRGACAWALGRIGGDAVLSALNARLVVETQADVRTEIQQAITASLAGSEP
jgi:epoxyqueuosine reductase